MAAKVKIAVFKTPSEAYMKFSEIKNGLAYGKNYTLSEMMIVKKGADGLTVKESIDTGVYTSDDTSRGMLIGAFIGILGGPLGVLLGSAAGSLVGSVVDSSDIHDSDTVIEKVTGVLNDGETAIIALIDENEDCPFDAEFSDTEVELLSFDAVEVMAEVDEAKRLEKELQAEARKKLVEEKKENFQKKVEDYKNELVAKFEKKETRED
ncbi:MAG: OmpH family outer membrane protein [Sphaerochaetaceae bacterium]|nr:OmpH family outer membrane protein [Sphaerochaetaceae bacterium]